MASFFSFSRLKDISIAKKLYFIVGAMAILIALELLTLWFSIHTLSAVRALVGAEGLWSKGQKDASYHLRKYAQSHAETDYQAFVHFMAVPMGDHITRLELLKAEPDMKMARKGFLEGRVHADDIDGMIKLLRRFHRISYINKAIVYWTQGDIMIAQIFPIADDLHKEITSGNPSREKIDAIISRLDPLNQQLTQLEDNFSYVLGEGSRWLENIVLKLLFSVALTVEITGLVLSIWVSRNIAKGLNAITKAATRIKQGDLSERAVVYSKDEIGQVAMEMNNMTDQLVRSNKELGHYAYIASHDLQEPLRTISNYVGLFQRKYKGNLDTNADEYLGYIVGATGRMQRLIKDLLDYSIIGNDKECTLTDCNIIIREVLEDMAVAIRECSAEVNVSKLPVINAYTELKLLFQNLISNAIKYRKQEEILRIYITAKELEKEWLFAVKDNGIGIEKPYQERIFIIFQKLHTQDKYAGTGIGLAHCKKIVELHGGRIWVNSEPGHGSTFYFTIPKNEKA